MFTVAKAMRLDLLEDIRGAVDEAIAEGATLREFRRRLTPTLQAKGWWGRQETVDPLTGEKRDVQLGSPRRLVTIYDVNLRTAHAAGRWEQIQRTKERRPYLRYVGISDEDTRPEHRSWQGTVLPVDDPWWSTHYPPNGWRCRCSVQQLSDRDLGRYGYSVSPDAPRSPTREWKNPRTGEVREVTVGIDPGFDYNVGRAGESAARYFAEKVAAAAPAMGARAWRDAAAGVAQPIEDGYERWARALIAGERRPRGEIYPIGALSPTTLGFLRARGVNPLSAGITVADRDLLHLLRDTKLRAGKAVPMELALRIPDVISRPRAVLWDGKALLYVFDVVGEDRLGKLVVRVNYRTKAERESVTTNSVRTAGLVERRVLTDANTYEVVEGEP